MMQRVLGGIGIAVAGVIGLLGAVQPAGATVPFPTKASTYSTWLARAMDECNSATVSVLTAGLPTSGCLQANSVTDDNVSPGATMKFARLIVSRTVNHKGRVRLFGRGFYAGQRMKVQLTLRVTKTGVSTPGGAKSITFQDITVACGNSPVTGCFTANLSGNVAGSMSLLDCMTENTEPTGLASGNVQILDSALLNCDTGKVLATPGILN